MKTFILSILLLSSCSTTRKDIISSWSGKSVEELEKHPVFSKIPYKKTRLKDGLIERNYMEQGKVRTKASCAGFGGCFGLPTGACQNVFTIKDGIIQSYEMKESCITDKSKLPNP